MIKCKYNINSLGNQLESAVLVCQNSQQSLIVDSCRSLVRNPCPSSQVGNKAGIELMALFEVQRPSLGSLNPEPY